MTGRALINRVIPQLPAPAKAGWTKDGSKEPNPDLPLECQESSSQPPRFHISRELELGNWEQTQHRDLLRLMWDAGILTGILTPRVNVGRGLRF